ncbi:MULTISPECIES: CapA family protein [unclassified Streptococcus]|uniref:CapA family protein n=1 Tax=unclassified Streptococcus TaxID=2608887 RepID=UPI001072BD08|nr:MULTISPECIES: CapA family protein [unclassified Streptococcus]MBF0788241.1 CapA family protein [Streptococcus sp. 19428wC2_LYSM12]MCQ9211373.1 CapA family protein [Streptococcus sp. B01]MCQ9214685.1 CapA family protein [Streptococcus sp. O1]TFV04688.1 CapA family protein [Streptococcus sp. LYSM12]
MRRRRDRIGKRRRQQRKKWIGDVFLLLLVVVGLAGVVAGGRVLWTRFLSIVSASPSSSVKSAVAEEPPVSQEQVVQTARIMAHGDLLYHDVIYWSAQQPDGQYDFTENFTYVKPWIEQADFAIADFEGTISADYPLSGYPLFNTPASVVNAIQQTGYDLVDLAHNHILDSHLPGLISTVDAFRQVGVDTVGVYRDGNRATAPIYVKEVNGIKIAVLAYAYGFNDMEENLSQEEYDNYMSDLNLERMKSEIERAEIEADVTVVMPQMGVEYQLEPTEEQVTLYRQMVEWGADIIFGGHPHVVEPTEIIEKDGERKLIVYSMGNFLSNQRMETMEGVPNAQWTERGVLMDVMIEKKDGKARIQTAKVHPTWVSRVPKEEGDLFTYQTFVLEDFIEGGRHRHILDEATKARVDLAYQEMKDFMRLNW